jgi:hypothetical protein
MIFVLLPIDKLTKAQKGKTAYRTPSLFKANKAIFAAKIKARTDNPKNFDFKKSFYGNI